MRDLLHFRRFDRRVAIALVAAASTALLGFSGVGVKDVKADTDPPAGTPATVTADALPTWQVDGVVWSMATVGNTVYAVGKFTKARPPGVAAGGAGEVVRNNILAFDITTGNLITSFNHSLNGQALEVQASPDGSKVYVGGEFTTVDGIARNRLVAFNTATGALDPTFKPSVSGPIRAIAATASTVYFGGNFFGVNGQSRTRLAAVNATTGASITAWRPTADDDEVMAMAMAPSNTRVIVGGRFQKINGATRVGVGALDATTGATAPWSSRPTPTRTASNWSYPTDFHVAGGVLYSSNEGHGGHWFDGRFAANPENGDLIWLDNCYGASYGVYATGQVLYSVSHAHDCSSLGAFPEFNPQRFQRALAETIYPTGTDKAPPSNNSNYSGQPIPSLLHWYPEVALGTFTGQYQGAWAVTGTSGYVALGGEFPRVNGKAQQGLVRFALKTIAPKKMGPVTAELGTPTATGLPGGNIRVGWKSTWDRDNNKLTYEVLRDGGTTPIGAIEANSTWWRMPNVGFMDKTAAPGTSHTYRIRVKDADGNVITGATSNAATPGAGAASAYSNEVSGDGPDGYWRVGEPSGSTAYDYASGNDLTFGSGVSRNQTGALSGDPDRATSFNGSSSGNGATVSTTSTPGDFTVEAWVKTNSGLGGKIVGYGDRRTGSSSSYDRHLYMTSNGRIIFGVYPNAVKTLQSNTGLNNNQWHHVVGTLSAADGMKLYIDGSQVAADPSVTGAQSYNGYWRVGGDNLSGWPSRPSRDNFGGTIDDVAVYPKALSAARIAQHRGVGNGTVTPNKPPVAAFTSTCDFLECSFNGSGSSDPDGTVAGYAWDFGDGSSGTGATPSHNYAQAGDYTVKLRVTDDKGSTDEIIKTVSVTSATLGLDSFGRTVSGGFGAAETGGSWSPVGAAADLSVDGSAGKIRLPVVSQGRGASLNGVSATGTDLTVRVSSDKVVTGNGAYLWVVGRKVAGAGEFRARVRLRSDGQVALMIQRINADNSAVEVAPELAIPGLTYAAGTDLKIRFQVTGTGPTSLKAKVWAAASAEPADWQRTGTDDTAAFQAAGSVGLLAYLSGSATNAPVVLTVDDFKAVRATG